MLVQLGEEFQETTPDGRDVTALVTFDGGKLVTVQTARKPGQKSTRTVRQLHCNLLYYTVLQVREMAGPDELVYTMRIEGNNGLVCVQRFKRT